ncbi:MAG TPA: zinc-ribbon domain-containing protein [Anaerolineales bacterium]|nr:zinc-ribbon domain-containing protein [Anaerolineales bacterium]
MDEERSLEAYLAALEGEQKEWESTGEDLRELNVSVTPPLPSPPAPSAGRDAETVLAPPSAPQMRRFCTRCGQPLKPGKAFCVRCGNPVED